MTTIGTWADQGVVISTVAGNTPFVPNVIFEGNAKILSGNVFKMWYSALGVSGGTNYAESLDGISWTQFPSNPVIAGQVETKIFKNGNTYYAYAGASGLPTAINVYTSPDGVTWTLQKANALVVGGAGTFDSAVCTQLCVLDIVNGVWYGYYAGSPSAGASTQFYKEGLATSTDGINWVKSPSNPIITSPSNGNFTFQKTGSAYFGWTQVTLPDIPSGNLSFPSDISRFFATNPSGPWTWLQTPTFYRTTSAGGMGIALGQVADPCLISVNGNLYLFYSVDSNGVSGTGRAIALAKASSMSVSQLVNTYEGVQNVPIPDGLSLQLNPLASDNFTRANANPIGGNWSPLLAGQTAQILSNKLTSSVAGTPGDSFWNALAWGADQWSQVTLGTVVSGSFAGAWVRMSTSGAMTGYRAVLVGGTGSGSATIQIQKYVAGVFTGLFTSPALTVNAGDTLTICMIGTQISTYWNGVLLWVGTDAATATGAAGFEVEAVTSTANTQITKWSGGNFVAAPTPPGPLTVYSVPDCRVAPFGPNSSRTVQGTKIYDVQISDNASVPGKDSRSSVPADSRVSPNIPQNSRAPGTFGPGE